MDTISITVLPLI